MSYGDYDNAAKDLKTLKEIIQRQGSQIALEAIAESIGDTNLKFKFSQIEIDRIIKGECEELAQQILERV